MTDGRTPYGFQWGPMTEYCTTCGGPPHGDGKELAGPKGHPMTWGRLAPLGLAARPEKAEAPPPRPDGPLSRVEALPEGAPRNAAWLMSLPAKQLRVLDTRGVWRGKEERILGIAGICEEDVRFYASWKWSDKTEKWTSREFWLRTAGKTVKTTWNDLRRKLK